MRRKWWFYYFTHDNQEMFLWDKDNIVDQLGKTISDTWDCSNFEMEKQLRYFQK